MVKARSRSSFACRFISDAAVVRCEGLLMVLWVLLVVSEVLCPALMVELDAVDDPEASGRADE